MVETMATRPTDIVLVVLMLVAFILLLARWRHPLRTEQLQKLLWHPKREEVSANFKPLQSGHFSDLLSAIAGSLIVSLSLVVLHSGSFHMALPHLDVFLTLRIFLVFNAIVILKLALGSFVAWVFQHQETVQTGQNIFLAYLTWLMWPLSVGLLLYSFLPFWPQLGYFILLVGLLLGLLLAVYRSFEIIILLPIPKAYLFFYLCALEIVPLLYLVYLW